MASIEATSGDSVMRISRFLGLNENPDGDTAIKVGEMAEMRNFRITQGDHLQKRPGTKAKLNLDTMAKAIPNTAYTGNEPRKLWGAWVGSVGGKEHVLAVYGGYIWDVDIVAGTTASKGTAAAAEASFFGFGGKVYLLNGEEYKSWDGGENTGFTDVTGYIPLVQTATTPAGAGTLLEEVNRLNGMRRVEFSPDGTAKTFQLPEATINEVTEVKLLGVVQSNYTVSLLAGTVTLNTAPVQGVNTLVVTYRKGNGKRSEVTGMRFAELFNGSSDTRVFLYGDGSNRAIYSGVDYDTGMASAEYFPDLYEVHVGESNTPITALVRHHARLMAFKSDSAWAITAGTVTLVTGAQTAAFFVSTVNRQFGNDAPGQVKILENNPLTLDAGGVYHWEVNNYSGGNENNAKRISDRVTDSLSTFDFKRVRTVNIKGEQEYWILGRDGRALILNYATDAWYFYDGLPFSEFLETGDGNYGFCEDGRVVLMSREYKGDDGEEIDCYAATGSMDFGRDWLLKYSPVIFVAMKPEQNASIYVSVETNRRSDYPKKQVVYSFSTFLHVDFNHFSFGTNRKPQVKKVKMKVKKAAFYRLIFSSTSRMSTATIIETDVQLRYAGNVR